jgi:hypothetical protein
VNLDTLEAIGREQGDAAARDLETFRARLRAAHREVPAVLTQIRALEANYLPELRRLEALPWNEYRGRLGSGTLVSDLRGKVDEMVGLFVGKVYDEFQIAPVEEQLKRLAPQIERLGVADRTRADEILADCRRAPEWPAVLVKRMFEVRDLYGRLVEALRRRGAGGGAVLPAAPGPGVSVITSTGPPRPAPAGHTAEMHFDPLA